MTTGVGVIGCGVISDVYIRNLQTVFRDTAVVALTDVVKERAAERAAQHGVRVVADSVADLVALPEVDIVLNLTVPTQHFTVSEKALTAGKHVYTEKPLGLDLEEGRALLALAGTAGRMVGSAPDTILGPGLQTARRLLDAGRIGRPFGAVGHMFKPAPETWHPDPAFLYRRGAGPLFDSGPYFLSALAYLLGPVTTVQGAGSAPATERLISSEPLRGQVIPVEVPTFLLATLVFEQGAIATIALSVDVVGSRIQDPAQHDHSIEIYGTEGVLSIPSPTSFGGSLYFKHSRVDDWTEVSCDGPYDFDSRGIGVADLASAVIHGRPPRAAGDLALHVLEALVGIERSIDSRSVVDVSSRFSSSAPLPVGVAIGAVDLDE